MQAKCPQCGHCCRIEPRHVGAKLLCHFCGKTWKVVAPHWPASGRIAVMAGLVFLVPGAALMFLGSFGVAAVFGSLYGCALLLWIGTPLAVIGLWTVCGGLFHMRQHRREDVPSNGADGLGGQAAQKTE